MYRIRNTKTAIIPLVICVCILLFMYYINSTFGEKHITDPKKYGKEYYSVELPFYFPVNIDDYTVNSYSYRVYSTFSTDYEIFLDITVTKDQFNQLISDIKKIRVDFTENDAYYIVGYKELIYIDEYYIDRSQRSKSDENYVSRAKIEKIIYNPETYRIVFVNLDTSANDYPLENVEYFNIFGIDEEEYLHWLNVRAFEATDTRNEPNLGG